MRREGLLHAELNRLIAAMGHYDLLVIADAGLPVPPGVPCIDLAVSPGTPGFFDVLEPVLRELQVQEGVVAAELAPAFRRDVEGAAERWGFPLRAVPHEEFKAITARARAVVRTGECTPYHNIILVAGVAF